MLPAAASCANAAIGCPASIAAIMTPAAYRFHVHFFNSCQSPFLISLLPFNTSVLTLQLETTMLYYTLFLPVLSTLIGKLSLTLFI